MSDNTKELPDHDIGRWTRTGFYVTIGISGVVAAAATGLSIAAFKGFSTVGGPASATFGEILPLGFTVIIAILTDVLSYAHSVSLRWALQREGRLHYNSNLRQFTSTKVCKSNRWPTNVLSAVFLITSYTAANGALYVYKDGNAKYISLNAVAFMALGFALIGQICIALWSLHGADKWVHSWSSNPLNAALASLNKGQSLRRDGRGMMSVHDLGKPPGPMRPKEQSAKHDIGQSQRPVHAVDCVNRSRG